VSYDFAGQERRDTTSERTSANGNRPVRHRRPRPRLWVLSTAEHGVVYTDVTNPDVRIRLCRGRVGLRVVIIIVRSSAAAAAERRRLTTTGDDDDDVS